MEIYSEIHNHNLNIHYTAPDFVWDSLSVIYSEMPHWVGFVDGCPQWYGDGTGGKSISASVEPSGLQFYAELPKEEWDSWFALFKDKASEVLGYAVGEPEEGFDFYSYD